MPQPLSVNPAELLAAAAAVDEQAATLAAARAAWDDAVHAARPGWIGRSRDALDELTEQWGLDSAALTARLADLAASLRVAAASFAESDRLHAGALRG